MTLWRTANDISQHVRFQRAALRAECKAGASLARLIHAQHPALQRVRCYQLVTWLPMVAEAKSTRFLRGLPGHLHLERLSERQREILAERCHAYEQNRELAARKYARDYMRRRRQPA